MNIPLYQVDAFTSELFHGNPAAVCILDKWLNDRLMEKIAMENNLSETAFIVREKDEFNIRWFTPVSEVKLCGHATLAAAHVLFTNYNHKDNAIIFKTKYSGTLRVLKEEGYLILDFPVQHIEKIIPPSELIQGIGKKPLEVYTDKTDYMLVYQNEHDIKEILPDFKHISQSEIRGIIVTAKGDDCDFVSRFFAPNVGVNEDPVTGSAHTLLAPYWAEQLKKNELEAKQLSKRQGILRCKIDKDRVFIYGSAVTYSKGEIIDLDTAKYEL